MTNVRVSCVRRAERAYAASEFNLVNEEVRVFAERVQDVAGRRWFIERRYSPWRLVVRPDAVLHGKYPSRTLTLPPRVPAPPRRRSRKENLGLAGVVVVSLPEAILMAVVVSVLFALVVPFTVAEVIVRAVASAGLAVLRAAGLARHRIDVVSRTGLLVHSETVLLVRGRRRARLVVGELWDERDTATRPFRPECVPADVTVRSHRSVWQSSAEWVT